MKTDRALIMRRNAHVKGRALIFSAILSLAIILIIPQATIRATATTSLYGCFFPSANHETLYLDWVSQGTDVDGGPKVCLDGNYIDITLRHGYTSLLNEVRTSDFNNADYHAGPYEHGYISGDQAPDNATITAIWVIVVFHGANPQVGTMWLKFTTDGSTWSGPLYVTQDATMSIMNAWSNNITAQRAWTPSMVKSANLGASFSTLITIETGNFLVDYLGFYYSYTVPYGGGYIPPGEVPPVTNETINPLTIPSPIALFGIIGFVGMIATPAAGIWFARRSDEPKMVIGIQVMIAFVVCFGLFLAGIA